MSSTTRSKSQTDKTKGKAKGTAKAAASAAVSSTSGSEKTLKLSRDPTGAPSQLKQTSRKGKKAWRKNVDITEVEGGLEELRMEERAVGKPLQKHSNQDLFVVDLEGDEKVKHILPSKLSLKNMTSTKILEQRSAVPAVFSRPALASKGSAPSASKKRVLVLSKEEKERLLRIAKRPKKGPFGAIMDPSEYNSGHSIVEQVSTAVKSSGDYDPWDGIQRTDEEDNDDGFQVQEEKEKSIKPPPTFRAPIDSRASLTQIDLPAVPAPHHGTSYNPSVTAHQELLIRAATVEKKKIEELDKTAEVKKRMDSAVEEEGKVNGMTVQAVVDDEEDEHTVESEAKKQKASAMKTKAQRNKQKRVLEEQRLIAERKSNKQLLQTINNARAIRKSMRRTEGERERVRAVKKAALVAKLREHGLGGTKIGRHRVPEGDLAVQLGEDLAESFRGLKPEGNLFKDRFESLQQRALIEPRLPVLAKKGKRRTIEYEKHAWKKFDR